MAEEKRVLVDNKLTTNQQSVLMAKEASNLQGCVWKSITSRLDEVIPLPLLSPGGTHLEHWAQSKADMNTGATQGRPPSRPGAGACGQAVRDVQRKRICRC